MKFLTRPVIRVEDCIGAVDLTGGVASYKSNGERPAMVGSTPPGPESVVVAMMTALTCEMQVEQRRKSVIVSGWSRVEGIAQPVKDTRDTGYVPRVHIADCFCTRCRIIHILGLERVPQGFAVRPLKGT